MKQAALNDQQMLSINWQFSSSFVGILGLFHTVNDVETWEILITEKSSNMLQRQSSFSQNYDFNYALRKTPKSFSAISDAKFL